MSDTPLSPIDIAAAKKLGLRFRDLSEAALSEYQLAKIRALIRRLKAHSLFYREHLLHISPEDIRTMDDFKRLPVTCEADLAGCEYLFQCVSASGVQRIITVPTTGTHGRSKRIAFTVSDLELALRFSTTAFTTFCKEGDRLLVFMSGNTAGGVGDSIRRSLECLNAVTYVYGSVTDIPKAFDFLLSYRPDIVVGIPCQIAALAEYGRLRGQDLSVRNVLLSSDDVPDAITARLEKIWNCEPFRHFGMTETCLMGGCECHAHAGYHMRNADHLFEVIDPDAQGYGELAITTFSHEAMPLLRYKTGDIAKMSAAPCACGGVLPRIEAIRGRKSNSFLCKDRRLFLRDLEEVIFSFDGTADFECSANENVLRVEIKTLPGSRVSLSAIENALRKITEDEIPVEISSSETLSFPYAYNAKKTL